MFAQVYDIKSQRRDQPLFITSAFAKSFFDNPLVLWLHNRIPPESRMSSSECSLSEERMQGKHRFCGAFAIRPKVRRSTGEVQTGLAIRYVVVPDETFDLIFYPGYIRAYNRGLIDLPLLATADHGIPACSVVNTTSMTNLPLQTMMAIFSTTPADLSQAVKTNWRLYSDLSQASHDRNS